MLALAGCRLGYRFRFFDTSSDAPAAQLGELHTGSWQDVQALRRFADGLDVITYEFENVSLFAAKTCSDCAPVWPPLGALEMGQDRVKEKACFRKLDIPSAVFREAHNFEELKQATLDLGFPCVIKTTTLGYDGKGQYVLRNQNDAEAAWRALAGSGVIVEQFIAFEREISVIAVRSMAGDIAFYPIAQNEHQQGILRTSRVPTVNLSESLQAKAQDYARRILEEYRYVGVMAIELFETKGELLANETAPRVHNTGHWSIDGAITSQFENHLRAITGLALGSTDLRCPTVMHNLLGEPPAMEALAAIPGAAIHLYGKSPRPGRKIGHINLLGSSVEELAEREKILNALVVKSSS